MSRVAIPTRDSAPEASRETLDSVHLQLGVVPSGIRLIASSPAVLRGYMGLSGALKKVLDAKTRERIALAVAEFNGCDYCLSAHNYLALNVARICPEEIELNRKGQSSDPKAAAAVRFAMRVTKERGHVSDADLAEVRAAGFSDPEIVAIVAVVAENLFTNMLNEVAQTDIDFPVVHSGEQG